MPSDRDDEWSVSIADMNLLLDVQAQRIDSPHVKHGGINCTVQHDHVTARPHCLMHWQEAPAHLR